MSANTAKGTACPDDDNPCTKNLCDGRGHCTHPADKTKNGISCGEGKSCQSGICQEEPGACGPGTNGTPCGDATTCDGGTLLPQGSCDGSGTCQPETPVSCAPYTRCDGNACATTCDDDNDCVDDSFCDGDHHCVGDGAKGAPCDHSGQCHSGFCAQGVCCNSVCGGECEACNLAGTEGTCATVNDGKRCGDGNVCCSGSCQGCCDSGDCSGTTPFCIQNTCQPCGQGRPEECPGSTCCDAGSGECVATCPASKPICDVDNVCKTLCQSHDDCGGSRFALCVDGVCHGCQVDERIDLQSAIDGTNNGETLYICPGSYAPSPGFNGDIVIGKSISIIGAGDGAGGTLFGGRVRTFAGTAAQPVTLRGLRISGPTQGVRLEAGHLTMTDCTVRDNPAIGVLNEGGTLEMRRCKVVNNTITGGNGGGIHNTGGPVTLRDCVIQGNTAAQGAGIYNIAPPSRASPSPSTCMTRWSGATRQQRLVVASSPSMAPR